MTQPPAPERPPDESTADAIGAAQAADAPGRTAVGDAEIREIARRLGENVLGPNAETSDQLPGPNRGNFEALAASGLLGMGAPRRYGGLDASGATQREVTQILASYCGVTTFIQAQHHGPSRMIASGPSDTLRELLLPDLARGAAMCAISFAHLRRPGPPVLRAVPEEGGYRIHGSAPWVTGWGLMNQVVFGATLLDGRFVYLWSPADRADFPAVFADVPLPADAGALRASTPLPLCAMNASATVELTLENWFIPEEHRLSFSDRETMRRNDRNGVLGATAMPLGCAAASVRVLCASAERRPIPAIKRAAEAFGAEWDELRGQIEAAIPHGGEPDQFDTGVRLRAWSIEFAVRAAHAAVTSVSGAANLRSHPAQRLLREAMFYTIQAQTEEVMTATLERLSR
ncbi:MAG TPA: acyl-CoA dehydrogenase family protein [Chthonomonadaceae bacterium]|nr:acyl-CoA dehydrogenase family protein [Chthonomonadaceae bacterium]